MDETNPEQAYELLASMGKALDNPVRLKLLHLLAQCERSVEDLSTAAETPLATVSHHLQRLRAVKLVRGQRDGRRIIYSLADREVKALWVHFCDFTSKRFPELAQLGDPSARGLEVIDRRAATDLLSGGEAILMDVRPAEEYRAGHIPGAKSVPLADLELEAGDLPEGKTLILYCRGPYCALADRAMHLLSRIGINAVRLTDGAVEHDIAGQPIEQAAEQEK